MMSDLSARFVLSTIFFYLKNIFYDFLNFFLEPFLVVFCAFLTRFLINSHPFYSLILFYLKTLHHDLRSELLLFLRAIFVSGWPFLLIDLFLLQNLIKILRRKFPSQGFYELPSSVTRRHTARSSREQERKTKWNN